MKNSLKVASALLLSVASVSAKTAEKPNVILIMADDMGWGDVGFNGNDVIATPCMDKLASEGVVLDRFYSACAVSSPTRCSVLTGRNPCRSGVFCANQGIMREQEISLAELLKSQDYTTGHFGKWHLGTLTDQTKDANRGRNGRSDLLNPPSLHGYDDSFVTESKVPTYDPSIAPVGMTKGYWDYLKPGDERERYGTSYWKHDGTKETKNLSGDDSRVIMDRVIPFIDGAKGGDTPFFSVIWFHTPHMPCVAGPKQQEMYKEYPLDKRNYYGAISAMDEQIGRLVDHLKRVGEFENTIIYFCSDNGPAGGEDGPGKTGGLSGRKASLLEGGVRVPTFVYWRGHTQGRVSQVPISSVDYFPTFLDIANIDNYDGTLDGSSIMPYLDKDSSRDYERPIIWQLSSRYSHGTCTAIRRGDYKLIQFLATGAVELYNLRCDPMESTNIADSEPKVARALLRDVETWRHENSVPLPPNAVVK